MAKGPILIEEPAGSPDAPSPAEAPQIMDIADERGSNITVATRKGQRIGSGSTRLVLWFWALALTVVFGVVVQAVWSTLSAMIVATPVLGYGFAGVVAALVLATGVLVTRQAMAYSRLRRLDQLQSRARAVHAQGDMADAHAFIDTLRAFYRNRPDMHWPSQILAEQRAHAMDADDLMYLAERHLMEPLDKAALKEIEATARQVASVTAIVPIALIDVSTALIANGRMIQRIAQIYGGRSGMLGNWRLTRAVLGHMFATGAISIGDDILSSAAGRSLLGTVSRRLGEGFVNGALSVRIGITAMKLCRPMPFVALSKPSVTTTIRSSLTGFFGRGSENT